MFHLGYHRIKDQYNKWMFHLGYHKQGLLRYNLDCINSIFLICVKKKNDVGTKCFLLICYSKDDLVQPSLGKLPPTEDGDKYRDPGWDIIQEVRDFGHKTIYLILSTSLDFFHDRPHTQTQNKPKQIKKNCINFSHSIRPS